MIKKLIQHNIISCHLFRKTLFLDNNDSHIVFKTKKLQFYFNNF